MFFLKTVQLFLDSGADVIAKDQNGNTPLHYLAKSRNLSNVSVATKLLLSKGAHLDEGNSSGATPLNYFKARKRHLDQEGSRTRILMP